MANYTPPTKTSDSSCNGSLMLVAFRLGYLQATTNQILARVTAMQAAQTAPPPKRSGLMGVWTTLQEASKKVELAHKLYRLLVWSRIVLWPAYIIGGLKWIGWLG